MVVFWIMLLVSFSSGVLITLVPDQTKMIGISNKGLFFTIYTVASLLIRVFFSKLSDKKGRVFTMKVSVFVLILSMIMIAMASELWQFFIASILFGISWGFNSPTLTAWTIDLSEEKFRGRAIATMYIALEAGIGLGAFFSGWIYQGDVNKISISYWLSALLGLVAMIILYQYSNKKVADR
jgi:MFS family permease